MWECWQPPLVRWTVHHLPLVLSSYSYAFCQLCNVLSGMRLFRCGLGCEDTFRPNKLPSSAGGRRGGTCFAMRTASFRSQGNSMRALLSVLHHLQAHMAAKVCQLSLRILMLKPCDGLQMQRVPFSENIKAWNGHLQTWTLLPSQNTPGGTIVGYQHISVSAYQRISMSSCEHVSMSACEHVSMSAYQDISMSACQHVSMSACQHVSMSACQHASMSACQHVSMPACQHVSMSAYIHIHMHIHMHMYTYRHIYIYIYTPRTMQEGGNPPE